MNHSKTYAEKGVQTHFVNIPDPSPNQDLHAFSQNVSPSNHSARELSRSSEDTSSFHYLDDFGAYIYSEVTEMPLMDDSRHISTRSAVKLKGPLKYGQLSCNRPSQASLANNTGRIASLPETSPPHRIKDTLRLVSMPDRVNALGDLVSSSSDRQLEYSECLSISLASDGKSNSRGSNADHAIFGRVPQTPSPPSSPESVMIIGNDTQVSQGFLRPKNGFDEENGGWIPWRASPPKPIPALHGPLSLPYARCPSGAEGTVVEGEDLSHMIWGLDSNNSHSASARGWPSMTPGYGSSPCWEPPSLLPKPTALSTNQHFVAHNICNQDIIDLSRPEFLLSLPNSHINKKHNCQKLQTYSEYSDDSTPFRRETRGKKTNAWSFNHGDSPIQLYPSCLKFSQTDDRMWNSGLGLECWQGLRDRDFPLRAPATACGGPPLHSQFQSEFTSANPIYQTPRGVSAYDFQAYDKQSYRTGIPTPPNTCSPRWSPHFHQAYLASLSPEIHYEQNLTTQPSQLKNTARVPRNQQGDFKPILITSSYHIQDPYSPQSGSESPSVVEFAGNSRPRLSYEGDELNINVAYDPSLECHDTTTHNTTKHPSPASSDTGRNLSHQQPRSIPLARLIQRRLSSVAEEETDVGEEDIGPISISSLVPAASQKTETPSLRVEDTVRMERRRKRFSGHKPAAALNSSAAPAEAGKQACKPISHLLRCDPAGKGRKLTTDHPNDKFGEQKLNETGSREKKAKSNKTPKKGFGKRKSEL